MIQSDWTSKFVHYHQQFETRTNSNRTKTMRLPSTVQLVTKPEAGPTGGEETATVAQPSFSDTSLERCSIISHQETLRKTRNILQGPGPGPRGAPGGDWVQRRTEKLSSDKQQKMDRWKILTIPMVTLIGYF